MATANNFEARIQRCVDMLKGNASTSNSSHDFYNTENKRTVNTDGHTSGSTSEIQVQQQCLALMRQREHAQAQCDRKKHKSYEIMPRGLFQRIARYPISPNPQPLSDSQHNAAVESQTELRRDVNQLTREALIARKSGQILSETELRNLAETLQKVAAHYNESKSESSDRINYEQFTEVRDTVTIKAARFFAPCIYLKFPRDERHRINAQAFFQYVCARTALEQVRVRLSTYDVVGDDHLRETDLENYIFDLRSQLPVLTKVDQELVPFYVFTAVRKIMFFLDPHHKGKIRINDLATSKIMSELTALHQAQDVIDKSEDLHLDPDLIKNNWFSAFNVLRIYGLYVELDKNQDGMLSVDELLNGGRGTLTRTFVERLFQEYHTYSGDLDFKAYLDFILCVEFRSSEASMRYIFHVLDTGHKGYLSLDDMKYFFEAVAVKIRELGQESPSVQDVVLELHDMVHPACPGRITLQDLKQSKLGHTVLHVLTDVQGFWMYDNREGLSGIPVDEAN